MRRPPAHERAGAVTMEQHALFDERGDRAPQRGARDVQDLRQLALAGQHVGGGEAAGGDFPLQRRAYRFEKRPQLRSRLAQLVHPKPPAPRRRRRGAKSRRARLAP